MAVEFARTKSMWGIQLNTVTMIATDELARQYRGKKALYCEV